MVEHIDLPGQCVSCGTSWAEHPGIMVACRENAALKSRLAEVTAESERYRQRVNELLAERDRDEWGKTLRLVPALAEELNTDDPAAAVARVKALKQRIAELDAESERYRQRYHFLLQEDKYDKALLYVNAMTHSLKTGDPAEAVERVESLTKRLAHAEVIMQEHCPWRWQMCGIGGHTSRCHRYQALCGNCEDFNEDSCNCNCEKYQICDTATCPELQLESQVTP